MAAACVYLRLYVCLVIFSSGKSIFEHGYFQNKDKVQSVEDCVGLKGDGLVVGSFENVIFVHRLNIRRIDPGTSRFLSLNKLNVVRRVWFFVQNLTKLI